MTRANDFPEPAVRAHHPLADYMPALAREVAARLGRPRVAAPVKTPLADFLKAAETAPLMRGIFPDDMKRATRAMRLRRTLADPGVEVDGVVLTIETRPKRYMYDKTLQLVATLGTLPERATGSEAAQRGPEPARASGSLEARLDALDRRLEVIEGLLRAGGAAEPPRSPGVVAPDSPAPAVAGAAPSPEHFVFQGRRLPRPLFAYRVDEVEENLCRLLRALGLPEVSRGALDDPEYGAGDCAARVARVLVEAASVLGTMPRVEPYAPAAADLGPVGRWGDLGPRLTCAARVLNRIGFARPDLSFEPWSHPELRDPV